MLLQVTGIQTLLKNRSCDFYTGLMSVSVFHELCNAISPLIKRRCVCVFVCKKNLLVFFEI